MNKEETEIFEKIKSILLSFKEETTKKQSVYGSQGRFNISNSNGFKVLSVNLANSNHTSNYLSDYDCFDILKHQIFEEEPNKTPLRVFMTGQSRFNSIITILLKKTPSEEISKNLIEVFFTTQDETVYENFFDKTYKAIQKKYIDPEFGKKITFQVLNQIGKAGSLPQFDRSAYTRRFQQITKCIGRFKIEPTDYPTLHNVFSYYESGIKNEMSVSSPFYSFLKEKIPTKDWEQFKKYCNQERNISSDYQMKGMFEEKANPKLHLNLNDRYIRNQYPVISLSPNDYISMMSMIIRCLNRARSDLNLEFCQSVPNMTNITTIYFLSKDEKPIDSEKMQSVIQSTIELYVEAKNKKQDILEQTLITAIEASALAFDLEKNKPEATEKKTYKPNKL